MEWRGRRKAVKQDKPQFSRFPTYSAQRYLIGNANAEAKRIECRTDSAADIGNGDSKHDPQIVYFLGKPGGYPTFSYSDICFEFSISDRFGWILLYKHMMEK